MKNKMMTRAYIVVFFLLLLSPLHAEPLTIADNGRTLKLEQNEELTIQLQGNPTTGYGWYVLSCDKQMLRQDGETEYDSESTLLGAGGLYTFTFQTVTPGETILTLVYHRPWEKDKPPEKTYTLHLQIQPEE